MGPQHAPPTEPAAILQLLYPWYKEEVYRRRQQMIWLTAGAAWSLMLLLFLVPTLPPLQPTHRIWSVLVLAGVLLFSGIMMYFIWQQRARHRMAKEILIKIEQKIGLYEKSRHVDDVSLYPGDWQTDWRRDRSELVYYGIILVMTSLLALALLLR
jgi:hypothetical protein